MGTSDKLSTTSGINKFTRVNMRGGSVFSLLECWTVNQVSEVEADRESARLASLGILFFAVSREATAMRLCIASIERA